MERKYKAFISYRHLPLDAGVAKRMHRRIEHFIIPRGLRKNGEKKLGYVFRDQDELPTSSDLTSEIRTALDNSEFLIVICTPETKKSRWVLNEISYFLQHHDRSRALAVLADGGPEESFPPQLTEIRSESGELLETIEPMAANLTADAAGNRSRVFQVESLRILAPLIGCSFDDLYRREQRYKLQRIGIASGVAAALAAVFIGILLNRNARIRANYEQSLRNQSAYLATESLNLLAEGDRMSAISLAIEALPSGTKERPLVSRAEYALGYAINAYTRPGAEGWITAGALRHTNELEEFLINKSETVLCTRSKKDVLTAWDTESMQKLWELPLESDGSGYFSGVAGFLGDDRLLAWTSDHLYCVDADSGEIAWRRDRDRLCENTWGSIYRVLLTEDMREAVVFAEGRISRLDAATGALLAAFPEPEITIGGEEASIYYKCSLLSGDGSLLAFYIRGAYADSFGGIGVMDLQNGGLRAQYTGISEKDFYLIPGFAFLGTSKIVFSTLDRDADGYILFDYAKYCRSSAHLNCLDLETNETVWETERPYTYPAAESRLYLARFAERAPLLIWAYSNHVDFADPSTGEILGAAEFLSPVVGLDVMNDAVRCYFENGEVGNIFPEALGEWYTTDMFGDNIIQACIVDDGFWTLQRDSTDVIRYSGRTEDKTWVPYEIAWITEDGARSFYADDSFVGDGCFALLDGNRLLISNGSPGSTLRELLLPADPENVWRTKYKPGRCRDGSLVLLYTDNDGCGLIDVNIETLAYEQIPWRNERLDLLCVFGTDHDDAGFCSVVCEHPDTSGEADIQVLSACVLDDALQIETQIPIGRFSDLTKLETTFNEAKRLYLYLPETGDAFCIDFEKRELRECAGQLAELFGRLSASGRALGENIVWSPDGSKLAAITSQNRLEVCRADGGSCTAITGETTELLSALFTPDGKQLLTVENDGYLRRYRLEDGALLGRTNLHITSRLYREDIELHFTSRGFLAANVGSILNLISTEDWEVFAYVPYCCGYLEEEDVFCCSCYGGSGQRFGSFPRYTTQALIEAGKDILNGWELSENQKLEYGLAGVPAAGD